MANREVGFLVGGSGPYTLRQMLESNAEDQGVCDWARSANPGDVFDSGMGEPCRCVSSVDHHDDNDGDRHYTLNDWDTFGRPMRAGT